MRVYAAKVELQQQMFSMAMQTPLCKSDRELEYVYIVQYHKLSTLSLSSSI